MSMIEEKFWAKVDRSDPTGCWPWTGNLSYKGYGKFNLTGTAQNAHRVAYILTHGEPAPGLVIDHMCYNRACVNPAHLRAVTIAENSQNRAGLLARNKSGYRGVSWKKDTQKWVGSITVNRHHMRVGSFDTPEEANAAVVAARAELHIAPGATS